MESKLQINYCCWEFGGNDLSRPATETDLRIGEMHKICGRKATYRSRFGKYYCDMHHLKEDFNLEEEMNQDSFKESVNPITDGEKITFTTGAQRCPKVAGETDLPLRYDLIPTGPLRRLAARYGMGAVKYGDDNYKKGIPNRDILNHIKAHIERFTQKHIEKDIYAKPGLSMTLEEYDDDDLAGAAWGIFTLMYFQMYGNPAEGKKDYD